MFASITHSLRSKNNVLVNSTTLYITVDGGYKATSTWTSWSVRIISGRLRL